MPSAESPAHCERDVLLLHFIELLTQGDMRQFEPGPLFGRKWCGVIGLLMEITHGLSHSRAGRCSN